MVDAFLAEHTDFTLLDLRREGLEIITPFLDDRGMMRTLPFEHGLEAFYAAALVRRESSTNDDRMMESIDVHIDDRIDRSRPSFVPFHPVIEQVSAPESTSQESLRPTRRASHGGRRRSRTCRRRGRTRGR